VLDAVQDLDQPRQRMWFDCAKTARRSLAVRRPAVSNRGGSMPLKDLAPILTTDEMDRSVRFYVDVLGFTGIALVLIGVLH